MRAPATITAGWADAIARFGAAPCPQPVLDKAALCLADFLSGAFEAAPLEWSRQAGALAHPLENGAAVICERMKGVPADAAFANAVAAHGLVREDMHTRSVSHLGVVVWPALLAAMAYRTEPVSGETLLIAGVAGYEVGARLGAALMKGDLARMFRPTGLVGPVAAAAACGVLLELDNAQMTSALGIAANTSGGFNEWPHWGGSDMYFHAGFAARNGLAAARLAKAGAFAAPSIMEGEAGLFRAIARTPAPDRIALFEGVPEILSVFHKQAPACNYAQAPCQAALRAAEKFNGTCDDIVEIRVRTTEAALRYPGCDHPGPFGTILQAKMSIYYGVAAAIARCGLGEENYADPAAPDIAALIAKVRLTADDALTAAYPERQGASVTILDAAGRETSAALSDIIVADADAVWARLDAAATAWLGTQNASRLCTFAAGLAAAEDARALDLMCAP